MRTYVFALFEKKGFGAAKTIYSVASSPWVSIILIHGGKLRRWVVNDELVDLQGTTSKPIVVVMKLENSSNIDAIRWGVFLQNFEILESLTWIQLITQSYDSFFLIHLHQIYLSITDNRKLTRYVNFWTILYNFLKGHQVIKTSNICAHSFPFFHSILSGIFNTNYRSTIIIMMLNCLIMQLRLKCAYLALHSVIMTRKRL